MEKRRVIYYTDELNDEFSEFKADPPVIDGSYNYDDNSFGRKLRRFFTYRILIFPMAWIYTRFVMHRTLKGKEKLRPYRKTGIFMYGNHTQPVGDAFMQACITYPRTNYVVVHPNNLTVPFFGPLTPALGALPIPGNTAAYRNFTKAIADKIARRHPVVIYPEAHIWPYYTKIRPFPETSFVYPVTNNAPAFCFVNTYQKRKHSEKPRIVTYIEGPFFPDESLDPKSRRKKLRDEVYSAMCRLAEHSDCEYIKYIKKEENNG